MYQKDITGSPIADVKKERAGRNYLIQHSSKALIVIMLH